MKTENTKVPGLLQPLPIPNQKWEEVSMDFITGLPMSEGKDSIMVVVDRLTKFAHFRGVHSMAKASQIAEVYIKEIHRLHGFPKTIVSDRDPKFTSKFWQELFRLVGTSLKMSTSYHPQTDGQTEVVNKCLEGYLRNYTSDKQNQWHKWLHLAEWWYNTTFHSSTQMTPFKALYGYDPPSLLKWIQPSSVPAAAGTLEEMENIIILLKDNLVIAQNRMKQQADLHRCEREFQIGDWVFLRLQPYKQATLKNKGKYKLQPRFYGPFKVTRRIGEVAYQLELPSSKIHNVFHVSCLKKKIGEQVHVQTEVPVLDEEGKLQVEAEVILQTRTKELRNKTIHEYLVKWKGLDQEDATWESEDWRQQNSQVPVL